MYKEPVISEAIVILGMGGILLWLVVQIIREFVMNIYSRSLRYKTFYANVPVCKKEYRASSSGIIVAGKATIPVFHPAEYNVYLMYEDKSHRIDNRELYEGVTVRDIIRVEVHKGYNRRGEVKDVYLSI